MGIIFILVYLVGWLAIISGIIFLYTKYQRKHHVPESVEGILGVMLLIAFGFLGITLMNGYKQEIEDDLRHTQALFCLGTRRQDGELLTEKQCEYFQDVLNGEYYEN